MKNIIPGKTDEDDKSNAGSVKGDVNTSDDEDDEDNEAEDTTGTIADKAAFKALRLTR